MVLGRVRYKVVTGFGPLKKESWDDESFSITLGPGEEAEPAPDVRLRCIMTNSALELEGSLKGQACYFGGHTDPRAGMRTNFIMTSVRNIEFRGSIEVVNGQ